jgi:methionine aminopeptidase
MSDKIYNLELLEKLGNLHRTLMKELVKSIDLANTNKDIYDYIDSYIKKNNLSKAFPIGISINHVIAHDSFHESNVVNLKKGDFIKIDVGLIEDGNIIDCARTFVYKSEIPQCVIDCEEIARGVEKFIEKQIDEEGIVSIQKISAITNALICSKGYNSLDYLGGHTIEYGKVHGRHYILNKPLKLLPKEASMFIDSSAEIGEEEMFAIEIYIGEKKSSGTMIKSLTIPTTHYQVAVQEELNNIKLNQEEKEVINKISSLTNNLVYEYNVHKDFNQKIIKKLIDVCAIIKHDALEFKSNSKEKIKYIQYEDCYLIRDNKLINLSR